MTLPSFAATPGGDAQGRSMPAATPGCLPVETKQGQENDEGEVLDHLLCDSNGHWLVVWPAAISTKL
jgi:hypothetical protein